MTWWSSKIIEAGAPAPTPTPTPAPTPTPTPSPTFTPSPGPVPAPASLNIADINDRNIKDDYYYGLNDDGQGLDFI